MNVRNLLLITVDCLRPDYLGCYGNRDVPTPNIDRLAEEGVLFENVVSNGSDTFSSVPSMFTSRLPNMLRPGLPSVVSALKDAGYVTAAFNPNALILLEPWLRPHRWFDHYQTFLSVERRFVKRRLKSLLTKLGDMAVSRFGGGSPATRILMEILWRLPTAVDRPCPPAERLNEEALAWIEEQRGGRFFVWVHYMDLHEPLLPPEEFLPDGFSRSLVMRVNRKRRYLRNLLTEEDLDVLRSLYRAEVRHVDRCVGGLVEGLRRLGHGEDTVVFLTADHGEMLGEHGKVGHRGDVGLYERLLRVPLIIHDKEAGGTRIREPVSLLDLGPTILDYASVEPPPTFQGQSLTPLIRGAGRYEVRPTVSFCRTGKRILRVAMRKGRYKIVLDLETGRRALYDLEEDPNEERDLSEEKGALAERLETELEELLARLEKESRGVLERERVRVRAARVRRKLAELGARKQ